MPINTSLLVSAPILQDYFVDNANAQALSNGVITMYQDNSRTTLKNWYYQTGSPGNYTYITLPNPMTLSAVGTMVDGNGNDIIPFYYPYSEVDNITPQPYYVTVVDSNGQLQFTRQNFPFVATLTPRSTVEPTFQNLVTNSVFWRNIGSLNATTLSNTITVNGNTLFYATIAPSQHDGFTMSDIQFFKDANGASDTITFNNFVIGAGSFSDQVIPNDITPEYYLNMHCSATGTETVKYIQIPIQLHVTSLSDVQTVSIVIDAMAVSGAPAITVKIFQYLGTGVTSPAAETVSTINLGNSWQKYILETSFPSAQGLTLGTGGDDALYLQIEFPVGASGGTYNINIAKPSIYLSEQVPTDDFQTYDSVNSIISSPRTGDLRISTNSFQPFGWVPMNDGTIGNTSSSSTTRANNDTWQLFNLLWSIAKPYDSGSNSNPICQMYTSGAAATNFGANAYADFSANKQLALTRMFGRVLLGTTPVSSLLSAQSTTYTASDGAGNLLITTSNNVSFFNGMPIVFTNTGGAIPTGLVATAVYYVSAFNGTNAFNVSTSFGNALAGTVITWTNNGSGTNTVTSAVTGSSEGEYAHTQLVAELAAHTHAPLSPGTAFIANNAGAGSTGGGGNLGSVATTASTGSSTPFNVTQPGTFYNIFIKL